MAEEDSPLQTRVLHVRLCEERASGRSYPGSVASTAIRPTGDAPEPIGTAARRDRARNRRGTLVRMLRLQRRDSAVRRRVRALAVA